MANCWKSDTSSAVATAGCGSGVGNCTQYALLPVAPSAKTVARAGSEHEEALAAATGAETHTTVQAPAPYPQHMISIPLLYTPANWLQSTVHGNVATGMSFFDISRAAACAAHLYIQAQLLALA